MILLSRRISSLFGWSQLSHPPHIFPISLPHTLITNNNSPILFQSPFFIEVSWYFPSSWRKCLFKNWGNLELFSIGLSSSMFWEGTTKQSRAFLIFRQLFFLAKKYSSERKTFDSQSLTQNFVTFNFFLINIRICVRRHHAKYELT